MVVCFGGINIDFIHTKNSEPKCLSGGVAYNIARHLAKLGNEVSLVSAVGCDDFGEALLKDMSQNRIDSQLILKIENQKTAMVTFEVVDAEAKSLSIDTTIHDFINPEALVAILPKIGHIKTWVLDTDLEKEALEFIALNKPAHCSLFAVVADSHKAQRITPILAHLQGLFLNQREASMILGQTISSLDEAIEAARAISLKGPQLVLLTLGSQGVAVFTPHFFKIFSVIPTTSSSGFYGAGDAFASGVVNGLINELPLDEAVRAGLALAALVNQP